MELLGTLPVRHPPFDFEKLLAIMGRFAYPVRNCVYNNCLWRINRSGTGFALVCHQYTDEAIHVYLAGQVGDISTQHILERSQQVLGLELDLSAFYAFAQADNRLWNIIQPLYGMPVFRTETVFEALVTLIIEQHIAWVNAVKSQMVLLQWNNDCIRFGDTIVYAFPTPHQLAVAEAESLKPLKITNKRIDFIIRIAQDNIAGVLNLEEIRNMPIEDAYQTLMAIKGVGHWTASNVLSRALGRFPFVTQNDVALQAAVNHYFYSDVGKKSAGQVSDTFAPYGEFAGLAADFTLLRWVLDRYPLQA